MQDHATIPPALAFCEPVPFVSENDKQMRELSRLLAELGTPTAHDRFAEVSPAAEAAFVQQLQVCEAPGAGECLVALPSPRSSTSSPSSVSTSSNLDAALEALGNEDFEKASALLGTTLNNGAPKREPTLIDKIRAGTIKMGTTVTLRGAVVAGKVKAKRKAPANLDKRPWERLPEAARLHAAAVYCEEVGGMAVSLNLHPDKHDRWTSGTLKTSITRLFRDGLNRRLDKAGIAALPYMLQFELSQDGRLHLHGVLDTHDRSPAEIEAIKLALRQAAGQIKDKAAGRQLMLKEITDGAGWATYINKARKQALAQLDLKGLCVTSQSMSGLAGDHHNNLRRLRRAA